VIEVTDIQVRSFDLDFLDLNWRIKPFYGEIREYSFTVEKSHRQYGPFFTLVGPFIDKYRVRDNTVRTNLDHYRDSYYRIKVIHTPTGETETYPTSGAGVSIGVPPDLQALEMARQERLILQECDGRLLWIFPRRTFGARCSCYDARMGRKLRSNCRTCYDTSWVGGFESPLQVYGQVTKADGETARETKISELSLQQARFRLPNYPDVAPGDVIVETENKRWRIGEGLQVPEKSRSIVRQTGQLRRIPEGDIEYYLPINVADPFAVQGSPPRNFFNPADIEMGDVLDTALGRFKVLMS
jgi:hypothetical protein